MQDEDNLREALRYSAAMLGELRTSYLSPQKYYELYMQVFDQLAHLEVRATGWRCAGQWAQALQRMPEASPRLEGGPPWPGAVIPGRFLLICV